MNRPNGVERINQDEFVIYYEGKIIPFSFDINTFKLIEDQVNKGEFKVDVDLFTGWSESQLENNRSSLYRLFHVAVYDGPGIGHYVELYSRKELYYLIEECIEQNKPFTVGHEFGSIDGTHPKRVTEVVE